MLEESYPEEIEILKRLFSEVEINEKIERLNTIYEKSEQYCEDYLNMIPKREVKYLLIAEAPPWSEGEEVTYVLNPKSDSRTLLNAVKEVFLTEDEQQQETNQILKLLAEKHFLIIDTIPFATYYSKSKKRNKPEYSELLSHTCESYFMDKLNNNNIVGDENLEVAFSLRKNAESIIRIKGGKLLLNFSNFNNEKKKEIPINDSQIATDGSNYPRGYILKRIYKLSE